MLPGFVRFRMGIWDKKENASMVNYFTKMLELPEGTDKCLYSLFQPASRGKTTMDIEDFLVNYVDVKTLFFYGSRDWMDVTAAKRLGKDKDKPNFKYFVAPSSGH